jgi:hypothetical protein
MKAEEVETTVEQVEGKIKYYALMYRPKPEKGWNEFPQWQCDYMTTTEGSMEEFIGTTIDHDNQRAKEWKEKTGSDYNINGDQHKYLQGRHMIISFYLPA